MARTTARHLRGFRDPGDARRPLQGVDTAERPGVHEHQEGRSRRRRHLWRFLHSLSTSFIRLFSLSLSIIFSGVPTQVCDPAGDEDLRVAAQNPRETKDYEGFKTYRATKIIVSSQVDLKQVVSYVYASLKKAEQVAQEQREKQQKQQEEQKTESK